MANDLTACDVHVWRAGLDASPGDLDALRALLDEDERGRAAAFAFERDRRRYLASHAALREILAGCLGTEPAGLAFALGPHGKPRLADAQNAGDLRFNMSHSGEVALYAVARGREVGIDVEVIRHDLEFEQMANQFFCPSEAAAIRDASGEEKALAFFECWVRKEAWVKAVGCGLSVPLDRFEVPMPAPESPRVLQPKHEPGAWSVQLLDVGPGHAAALVVEGDGCTLALRDWPEDPLG